MRTETSVARAQAPAVPQNRATLVAIVGWLLPGAGYFLQKKWVRGTLVLLAILGMFIVGVRLGGRIYGFNTGELLDMLSFVGDVCAGVPYFLSRLLGIGAGLSTVSGDFGTKFIVAAGLLNVLAAADAHDLALGRKS